MKLAKYGLVAAMIVFAMTGCNKQEAQAPQAMSLPVASTKVSKQTLTLSFEYPARLKSPQSANVYARVEGILLEQKFKEGDIVKKGDKLFKIDPITYQNNVDMAEAQYRTAQANLTKATRDWERIEKLYNQGIVTVDTRDTSLYNFQSAQATLANTKAALDSALVQLEYTDVIASFTGRTGIRQADVGNLVGRTGVSDVLTTITQLTPIYAEFSIPSVDYYYIRELDSKNITAQIILDNGAIYDKEGKIDFIDNVLDSQTLSVKVRAVIENDAYKLLPNEIVRIKIDGLKAKDAITIPQNALLQDTQGNFVYLLKDGKAQMARISVGKSVASSTIVLEGLNDGDEVITSNLTKLRNEMPVSKVDSAASPMVSESTIEK